MGTDDRRQLEEAAEVLGEASESVGAAGAGDLGWLDRAGPGAESLRRRAARGTIVNAAFMVGVQTLSLLKGGIVAAFLTRSEYGLWGILVVALGTLGLLKEVGVSDKYLQQDEADQELAFQKAFTIDAMLNGVLLLVILAALPIFALAYGREDIILPGLALTLAVPAVTFQAPLWILYRRMNYRRQRTLQAIDPVVAFAVTVGLAAAGLGYWSLVAGTVAGTTAAGIAAVATSTYPIRFRYDRGTLRQYASFSWPLFIAAGGGVIVAQASVFAGDAVLGLAGVGAIALASTITLYTDRVDHILTETLYPAICAVKDRTDTLFETFVKSNRLTLMWGFPFGVGLALFAPALVEYVLGRQWEPAVGLIQAFGLIAAVNHIGFNWTAYYRARGETRPIAIVSVLFVTSYLAIAIPLLVIDGLEGLAIGMAISAAIALAARAYFVTRLFPRFRAMSHAARAIAPTVPAAAAVLLIQLLDPGVEQLGVVLAELGIYLAVTALATFAFERTLLREALGYVRGEGRTATSGVTPAPL